MQVLKIQVVQDRVEASGESIVVRKTEMNTGFIAVILDTEGNRVGLHAER